MANKTRCKRCGAFTPGGYIECQPKVVYRTQPLSGWIWLALTVGSLGGLIQLLNVVMPYVPAALGG